MKPTPKQLGYATHIAKGCGLLKPILEEKELANGNMAKVNVSQQRFEEWVRNTYSRRTISQLINLLELIDRDVDGAEEQFNQLYKQ